ncbi:MAG: hypothetical protein Q9171_003735 [Xanthocarpia ochracea]
MALNGQSIPNNLSSAHLLGLPDELLLQIVAFLWHSDLENFSACCKGAHRVSDEQMAIHLSYKRRYSTVVVPEYDRSSLTSERHRTPAVILNDSLNKGVLGEYIQKLVFDDISRYIESRIRSSAADLPKALKGLKKVLVGRSYPGGGGNVTLAEIYPFTGLPNIHTLRVYDLVDRKPSLHRNDYHFSSGISSLTKLELIDSRNSLESFTYEVNHEVQHTQQFDWDPRSVLRILRHYALESLTQLTIVGSRHVRKMGQLSCGGFVGSLVQFSRLQIGGRAIGSGDSGIAETVSSNPPTQSIVDLFPPSLETLKLVRRDQTDIQMERMLGGVSVGCKALPCLKEVAVRRAVDPGLPIR